MTEEDRTGRHRANGGRLPLVFAIHIQKILYAEDLIC